MSLEDTLYIGEMIKTVYRPTAVVPTIVNRSKNSSLLFIKEKNLLIFLLKIVV